MDNQLNSPWSGVQRDLAAAKQTWWDANEPAYLAWIGQTSAADTAYQGHVNAAYLGRTGGWTGADVDYTHDVAAAARQLLEDRADEQYDYLMDQASRSYTYVDQYAQSRHDARVAWAAADRWSRLGQDDSGADYDSERHGQDVQAAHDAFVAATDTSRREYRRHRATGEAHREIRLAEIDLQYVEDVAGAYVDWTAEVELHRRAFTESESTEAWGRTYAIAADDDSYWRQEAGTFAADLAASYSPSSSGPFGAPWGTYAAAQELAEAAWVTTTSTARRVWEDTLADARKTERFDVATALETRNNRLAEAWADREITKAQGRLQTARTGAYDDVIATLAGTRQQPLPRLPDCSPSATGEPSAAFYQAAECLPAFSPLNLSAVLPDDYQIPAWGLPPTSWATDYTYGLTTLTWIPPAQLADSQVHPVTPPLPASYSFISAPAPSPLDLSASLSSTDFPQYYNNVIDLIFGKWDFDAKSHLRGFRTLGTAVDAVFRAYASPPTDASEHLVLGSANPDGTSGTTSGDIGPNAGYPDSANSGSSSPGGSLGGYWPTGTGETTLVPETNAFSALATGCFGGSGSPFPPFGSGDHGWSDHTREFRLDGAHAAGEDSSGGIQQASDGTSAGESLWILRAGVRPQTVSGYSAPRPLPFPSFGESDGSAQTFHLPFPSQVDTLYHRYLSSATDSPSAERSTAVGADQPEREVVVIIIVAAGDSGNSEGAAGATFDLSTVYKSQIWKEWTAQELLALGRSIGPGVELINTYGFAPTQLALIRQGQQTLEQSPYFRGYQDEFGRHYSFCMSCHDRTNEASVVKMNAAQDTRNTTKFALAEFLSYEAAGLLLGVGEVPAALRSLRLAATTGRVTAATEGGPAAASASARLARFGMRTPSMLDTDGAWRSLGKGIRLKRVGNYWIKEVDPSASAFWRWWGTLGLDRQASGLGRIGRMAPKFLYKNGKLIIRDAGQFQGTRVEAWIVSLKTKWRLGTVFDDAHIGNIGANGLVFDPCVHPVMEYGVWWPLAGGLGTLSGRTVYLVIIQE